MVLNTIRLELRCRVKCNLASSMRNVSARLFGSVLTLQGDFRPESEALEPDADVENLTMVLLECEELVSRTLAVEDRE